jgi:hypothetical protein
MLVEEWKACEMDGHDEYHWTEGLKFIRDTGVEAGWRAMESSSGGTDVDLTEDGRSEAWGGRDACGRCNSVS